MTNIQTYKNKLNTVQTILIKYVHVGFHQSATLNDLLRLR